LCRCLLLPCLGLGSLVLLAGLLAGLGFFLTSSTFSSENKTNSSSSSLSSKSVWLSGSLETKSSCGPGQWGVSCSSCMCSLLGSSSQECDETGRCTCVDGHSGHKCDICPQGTIELGGRCPPPTMLPPPIVSGCDSSPCLGPGSTCESHDSTFTCYCSPGRSGKFCEKVTPQDLAVAGFSGRTLVTLRTPPSQGPAVSLTLRFRSRGMEGGVLVSTSQYSLTLEQGHLVLRSGESLILSTVSKLKAGVWYRVVLRTYREEARLTVGEEVVQGVVQGGPQDI